MLFIIIGTKYTNAVRTQRTLVALRFDLGSRRKSTVGRGEKREEQF